MAVNPALALQMAIKEALAGDAGVVAALGGARIHDDVPQDSSFPYATIGDIQTEDWSTQDSIGHEHRVTIRAWSRHRGRKEVQRIIGEVERVLDGAALQLDGHRLVNLRAVFRTALREADGELYQGIIRFRAVTEVVA
ncbi:MAG: DUF3168 domain-containing protein [Candidatus Rokubacteria bacterium]|nr:DUF3168 domain-containing protein [Candidatus Rokubacteria bacterium]